MSKERILIVDDDKELLTALTTYLEMENMRVTSLSRGSEVMNYLNKNEYDLVLIDVLLGDADGIEILVEIRKHFPSLPVFVLSAKDKLHNKILGLRLGADDYITKPFCEDELIARIKNQINRVKTITSNILINRKFIYYDELKLDINGLKLFKKDCEIQLNARIFKILKLFMEHPDQILSKEQIYDNAWEDNYYDENTIMVYMRRLRKIIEDDPNHPQYIHTIRGMGYKLSKG